MRNFLEKNGLYFVAIPIGIAMVFLIQVTFAYSVSNGPNPDFNDYIPVRPYFPALLIGGGTPPANGDVKVSGNAVMKTKISGDSVQTLSGGALVSNGSIELGNGYEFGNFYTREAKCTSCSTYPVSTLGGFSGMSRSTIACDPGDLLVSCTGYNGDSTKTFFGTRSYKSNTWWSCQALSDSSTIVATAVCFSPNTSTAVDSFN